jgi:hypothetical protein
VWIASSRRIRIALLGLLGVGLLWANLRFAQVAPGGEDFLTGWTAARLWMLDGLSPYDPEVARAAGELLYGQSASAEDAQSPLHFTHLLPAAAVHIPFALLPYPVARAVWMTLLELSLPATLFLSLQFGHWRPRPGWLLTLLLFSVVWYHGLEAILAGSIAPFEALLVTGALLALERQRYALSGGLLVLTAVQPGPVLLLLLWVLIWGLQSKRWGLTVPLITGLTLLAAVSWAVLPGWPQQWAWRWLEAYAAYEYGSGIGAAAALFGRARSWVSLALGGLLVGYSAWEWFRAGRQHERGLLWAAQLAIITALLLLPHRDTSGYVLLLPAVGMVCASLGERGGRAARLGVPLILALLSIGPWALYAFVERGGGSPASLLLFAPVLTLLGLWWIRWWAIRPPLPSVAGG